jgi:cell fate (sporulation/competence/biofilm development) regulator YlbF (YheA/YmcA/DUF963 family)
MHRGDNMQEILRECEELGLMIKRSEDYIKYIYLSGRLNNSPDDMKTLQEFVKISRELAAKEASNLIVDVWEKDQLADAAQRVSENPLVSEYLEAQSIFMELMNQVFNAIEEGLKTQDE